MKSWVRAIYGSARAIVGPPYGVCIYTLGCDQYAAKTLLERNWIIAIPLITLRVISCNPITALLNLAFKKFQS